MLKSSFSLNSNSIFSRLLLNRYLVIGCLSFLLLSSFSCEDTYGLEKKEMYRKNAIQFYKDLYSSNQPSVKNLVGSAYKEHQISAGFTFTGLEAYAKNRVKSITNHTLIIHRTLVQGKFVGLHIEEKVAADSSVARMALLRFDNEGSIVEHWEAMQGQPQKRANPNTMFDGLNVNYKSSAGSRYLNETIKADMQVFNNYDTLLVRQTRAEYIQHNPLAGDGPDALIELLVFLKTSGFKTVATNYLKLAEGDFVMALNNYETTPAFPGLTNSVAFDLIRLNEAGKEAEHWDVLEEIGGADKKKAF